MWSLISIVFFVIAAIASGLLERFFSAIFKAELCQEKPSEARLILSRSS